MGPQKGSTNDLATLNDLDESTLIDELLHRYRKHVIYVSILIKPEKKNTCVSDHPRKKIGLVGRKNFFFFFLFFF